MPRQRKKRKKTNRVKSIKEHIADNNRKENGGYFEPVPDSIGNLQVWKPFKPKS